MRTPTTPTTNKYIHQNITAWVRGTKLTQQKEKTQKNKNKECKERYSQAKIDGTQKNIPETMKGEEQVERERQVKRK